MVLIHARLAIASLFFACATLASAADPTERYDMKAADAPTGSLLKRSVIHGDIPFDKRYDELTAEQRAHLKASYEAMAADDEPPFPADGLGGVMKNLKKGADLLQPNGTLDVAVEVGPDGLARSVKVFKGPDDPKFMEFATQLLMMTKYKSAVCSGRPCTMWFPYQVTFVRP